MSTPFTASLNEEQLIKILRDGFGNGLAKTLGDQLVDEFKRYAAEQLQQSEKLIREQVQHVVSQYMLKAVSFHNDHMNMTPVVQIFIEKKGADHV